MKINGRKRGTHSDQRARPFWSPSWSWPASPCSAWPSSPSRRTESAIAVNQRNYVQSQAAAEAGAKVAVEWFQDAEMGLEQGHPPAQQDCPQDVPQPGRAGTSGYYKSVAGELLFDIPFKISDNNRFFGNVDTADVKITRKASKTADDYLTTLNTYLFGANADLRVSDIRVYAPPMPGAQLVNGTGDSGFWQFPAVGANARYGVATIRVTAQKFDVNDPDRVIAERMVKLVLAETPFPTVDGAIETSGSLVGQGKLPRLLGQDPLRERDPGEPPRVGMPWFDAEEQMNFEYGFNSTFEWQANTTYQNGAVIHAPNVAVAADPIWPSSPIPPPAARPPPTAPSPGRRPSTGPSPTAPSSGSPRPRAVSHRSHRSVLLRVRLAQRPPRPEHRGPLAARPGPRRDRHRQQQEHSLRQHDAPPSVRLRRGQRGRLRPPPTLPAPDLHRRLHPPSGAHRGLLPHDGLRVLEDRRPAPSDNQPGNDL
jgi:hypothetical protein